MKDSTRDKIVKVLNMYRKKSQYSICQQQKKVKLKLFSPYTHTSELKNISKANSFSHLVTEVRR